MVRHQAHRPCSKPPTQVQHSHCICRFESNSAHNVTAVAHLRGCSRPSSASASLNTIWKGVEAIRTPYCTGIAGRPGESQAAAPRRCLRGAAAALRADERAARPAPPAPDPGARAGQQPRCLAVLAHAACVLCGASHRTTTQACTAQAKLSTHVSLRMSPCRSRQAVSEPHQPA